MKSKGLTRRDFICGTASIALLGTTASAEEGKRSAKAAGVAEKSRVILIREKEVMDENGSIREEILRGMLDDGVVALFGESDAASAWARLVKPSDTVGIKSNVWSFLPTPSELETGIRQRIVDAGVPESRISIDDRGVRRNPIFRKATALINVRPMRTHNWSGVGGLIKNYIMFSKSPWSWHGDSCANLAGVWNLPIPKGKTRLNILVMLTPLFHGKGPHHFHKRYTWPYKGLLIGTDPVAVDATGLGILEAKRRAYFGKDLSLAVPPKHIRVAQDKYRLGVADPGHIEVIKLGWMDDVLI